MSVEELPGFSLETVDGRLGLRDLTDPRLSPLVVDFLDPAFIHRLKHGVTRGQPLPRALGLRSLGSDILVFDATAGLGTDSFFIAALGCRVRAVERHPVIAALLLDAVERLQKTVALGEVEPLEILRAISGRLSFEEGSSLSVLSEMVERPDVVYFDPMYPEEGRSESALPKKAMQIFRRLIGADDDASAVFELALSRARDRVVVKRPLRAPALVSGAGGAGSGAGVGPTHSFEGKTARFDMYLCR